MDEHLAPGAKPSAHIQIFRRQMPVSTEVVFEPRVAFQSRATKCCIELNSQTSSFAILAVFFLVVVVLDCSFDILLGSIALLR